MEDRPLRGTKPSARYQVVLEVPEDAELVAYGTLLHGAGALRMTDVVLEVVDATVPVTEPSQPRRSKPGYHLAGSAPEAYEASGDPETSTAVLRSKVVDSAGFATLMRTMDAGPFRGRKVRLAGRASADDVRGWAGLWLRVDGADGKPIAFDNMQGRALRGTMVAARYEVVLDVPQDATRLAFGAILSGSGRMEVTELTLTTPEADAASTDLVRRRRTVLDTPTNLGFEGQ
jgi:hypothetical protein